MTDNYSMIIENRTENRLLTLIASYFLEFCGYLVLENIGGMMPAVQGKKYQKVVICEKAGAENAGNIAVTAGDWKTMLSELCQRIAQDEDDYAIMMQLLDIYDIRLFRELYTICCLYSSRIKGYKQEERLRDAVKALAVQCDTLEKNGGTQEASWRRLYAYLYLVNKANEGMFKLREYQYQALYVMQETLERLKERTQASENVLLLEADILSNAGGTRVERWNIYKSLALAGSYCVSYRALCGLGELYQEEAQERYQKIPVDNLCVIQAEYYESTAEQFAKALELKADAIHPLFKVALQHERKGQSDLEELERARVMWEKLRLVTESIPVEKRTTLEFEYLYKAFVRLGWVLKLQGKAAAGRGKYEAAAKKYEAAAKKYDEAEKIWETLADSRLIDEIYPEESGKVTREILEKRYEDRWRVFDYNRREIKSFQDKLK